MEDTDRELFELFRFEIYRIASKLTKYWQDDIGYRFIIELSSVGLNSEDCSILDELK